MGLAFGIILVLGIVIWSLWRLQDAEQGIMKPLRDKVVAKAQKNPMNKALAPQELEQEKEVKPAYKVQKPLEAVAMLIVGLCSLDTAISAELQQDIELIFEADFGLTRLQAKHLFEESELKLESVDHLIREVPEMLKPSLLFFRKNQVQGVPNMLEEIANLGAPATVKQLEFLAAVRQIFAKIHH